MAQLPMAAAPGSVPVARERRRLWEIGVSILVVALAAGVFLYADPPVSVAHFVDVAAPAVPANATTPAPTVPHEVAGATHEPPAVADTRSAALRALAVEPQAPEPEPAASAALATPPIDVAISSSSSAVPPPAQRAASKTTGRARNALRPADAAAALPVHKPDRPGLSWQAPAPAGPCTPTVAALGLCTAPPMEAKE